MNGEGWFIGIVDHGEFKRLLPSGHVDDCARLTRLAMQAALPPETGELNLEKYEGMAIMVRGYDAGGWIYSAEIVDRAGPILTAVVQQVFGPLSRPR